MSERKRRAPTDAQAATDGGGGSDLDTTTTQGSYTEATNLLFDQNRVFPGASSFWIQTRPDISLSAIIPQETVNPSSRLVFLSNILFSSLTTTCQRWRNTCRPRWMHCGATNFTPCGTLIPQCILQPPTKRPY